MSGPQFSKSSHLFNTNMYLHKSNFVVNILTNVEISIYQYLLFTSIHLEKLRWKCRLYRDVTTVGEELQFIGICSATRAFLPVVKRGIRFSTLSRTTTINKHQFLWSFTQEVFSVLGYIDINRYHRKKMGVSVCISPTLYNKMMHLKIWLIKVNLGVKYERTRWLCAFTFSFKNFVLAISNHLARTWAVCVICAF